MALVKCKECGHEIGKTASSCPQCGAKVKRTSLFTKIVTGFFALMFLSWLIGSNTRENQKAEEAKREAAEQVRLTSLTPEQRAEEEKRKAAALAAKIEAEKKSLGLTWNYAERLEPMGRGTIKWASISSVNQIQFDFPYQGLQRARLDLRIHPKYGKDVILSVEKGQLLCHLDGCRIAVRFNDGKPQNFSASEPADHSTTSIFINDYSRFVNNLRRAKKLFIEAQFYQEGMRVFEFDVEGLIWEGHATKKASTKNRLRNTAL
jgi:hypothetical protein